MSSPRIADARWAVGLIDAASEVLSSIIAGVRCTVTDRASDFTYAPELPAASTADLLTRPMREFLRGAVRLNVLHHAAEGDIHGAWMSEELANHGYKISPGTLYPTLHRTEAAGLLASRRVVVDGRSRRVYRATRKGRAVLDETRRASRELADEVLE